LLARSSAPAPGRRRGPIAIEVLYLNRQAPSTASLGQALGEEARRSTSCSIPTTAARASPRPRRRIEERSSPARARPSCSAVGPGRGRLLMISAALARTHATGPSDEVSTCARSYRGDRFPLSGATSSASHDGPAAGREPGRPPARRRLPPDGPGGRSPRSSSSSWKAGYPGVVRGRRSHRGRSTRGGGSPAGLTADGHPAHQQDGCSPSRRRGRCSAWVALRGRPRRWHEGDTSSRCLTCGRGAGRTGGPGGGCSSQRQSSCAKSHGARGPGHALWVFEAKPGRAGLGTRRRLSRRRPGRRVDGAGSNPGRSRRLVAAPGGRIRAV